MDVSAMLLMIIMQTLKKWIPWYYAQVSFTTTY